MASDEIVSLVIVLFGSLVKRGKQHHSFNRKYKNPVKILLDNLWVTPRQMDKHNTLRSITPKINYTNSNRLIYGLKKDIVKESLNLRGNHTMASHKKPHRMI